MNPEYFRARFRCVVPREALPDAFAVVTACNPDDAAWSVGRNRDADAAFARELEAAGIRRWRITGGSEDFLHREPGWGVDCGGSDKAVELGRRLGQRAVFWIEQDRLELVDVVEGTRFDLGSWSLRTEFLASSESAGWIQDR